MNKEIEILLVTISIRMAEGCQLMKAGFDLMAKGASELKDVCELIRELAKKLETYDRRN